MSEILTLCNPKSFWVSEIHTILDFRHLQYQLVNDQGQVLPLQIYKFFIVIIFTVALLVWRENWRQKIREFSLVTLGPSYENVYWTCLQAIRSPSIFFCFINSKEAILSSRSFCRCGGFSATPTASLTAVDSVSTAVSLTADDSAAPAVIAVSEKKSVIFGIKFLI